MRWIIEFVFIGYYICKLFFISEEWIIDDFNRVCIII